MDNINLLQSVGLSKSEAQLYLSNLELGPASAIQLGQHTGFSRQMMYNLLPGMIDQGFTKQLTIGKRHYFQSVDPKVLEDRAKQVAKEIAIALPLLKNKQAKNTAVPTITIYDNPLSMREWYRYFMKNVKKGEEKLVYSTESKWFDLDTEFYQKFADFQTKKETKNRIIAPDTPEAREVANKIQSATHTYRFSKESWGGDNAKWIWRNQVVHLTIRGKETNLIVVESEDVAEIERFAFNIAWEALKPS